MIQLACTDSPVSHPVFGVVPKIPIRLNSRSNHVKKINAVKNARKETIEIVVNDRIKPSTVRNVFIEADPNILFWDKALMSQERPDWKWVGLYLVNRCDKDMLRLVTDDRLINIFIKNNKSCVDNSANSDLESSSPRKDIFAYCSKTQLAVLRLTKLTNYSVVLSPRDKWNCF